MTRVVLASIAFGLVLGAAVAYTFGDGVLFWLAVAALLADCFAPWIGRLVRRELDLARRVTGRP